MNTKIHHFGQRNHKDTGSFTIVSTVTDNFVEYGVSFCSPKDVFSKKVGASIAKTRLADLIETGKFRMSGTAVVDNTNHVDVTFAVLASIASSNLAPTWAVPLVLDELIDYSFKAADKFYAQRHARRAKHFNQ
jgi:hypothetical protein